MNLETAPNDLEVTDGVTPSAHHIAVRPGDGPMKVIRSTSRRTGTEVIDVFDEGGRCVLICTLAEVPERSAELRRQAAVLTAIADALTDVEVTDD